jgi:hypothetical protein
MAKQVGTVTLSGKMNDIIFYHSQDGALARMAGGLNKDRVKKDKAFEGSRRASAAFKHVGEAAGLLRRAMGPKAMMLEETRMTGKLSGKIWEVLKSDTMRRNDERRIYLGNMGLLKGFQWNSEQTLDNMLRTRKTVAMDRENGVMEVLMDSFVPTKGLDYPAGATHFEVIGSGAAIDFDKGVYEWDYVSDGVRPINGKGSGVITISCKVGAGSTRPLLLGVGVVFYQEVNGIMNMLKGGGAFGIVGVEGSG